MSAAPAFDPGREPYVSLASFRRSGKEVRTPVWIAPLDGRLVVYTNGRSGKVKRIRNDGRIRLAACDVRGKLRGDWVEARARLVEDPEQAARGVEALVEKYGWQMRLARLAGRLSGRWADHVVLEIEIPTGA